MKIHILLLILISLGALLSQTLFINEVMSSNASTIYDEDGDTPDWIEIYNAGTTEINLADYGLSDDIDDPFKWIIPGVIVQANDFILVYASGKNRTLTNWETIIDLGDEWNYFIGTQAPPENWYLPDFDDSNWLTGVSGFGAGDGDDATIIEEIGDFDARSVFLRHSFDIADVNDVAAALLHIDYDDAFVAWLNGVEIARENIGEIGDFPAFDDSTTVGWHEAQIYQGEPPNHYLLENLQDIFYYLMYIQTLNIDPENSYAHFNYANLLFEKGNYEGMEEQAFIRDKGFVQCGYRYYFF